MANWSCGELVDWRTGDPLAFGLDSSASMQCNSESVRRDGLGRFWNFKMWRLSLVIYLLLAAGLGNSSCCCTAARWSGWLSTWGLSISALSSENQPGSAPSACCESRAGRRTVSVSPGSAPAGWASPLEEPTGPSCDCPSGGCRAALSRLAELTGTVGEADDLVRGLGEEDLGLGSDRFRWPLEAPLAWTEPPPITGRETRISHCSWRC